MNSNSLAIAGQTGRFTSQAMQIARPSPASPLVLQKFMQLLAELNHKVDTLSTRAPQQVQVRHVESRQVDVESPAKVPEKKFDLKKLKNIFD
ncbi:MAG TPA: hypothetical protein ENH94_04730 [Phycisphaerales bacterium]|nr:hypothetical protein [Phycisphaerales bacterium]